MGTPGCRQSPPRRLVQKDQPQLLVQVLSLSQSPAVSGQSKLVHNISADTTSTFYPATIFLTQLYRPGALPTAALLVSALCVTGLHSDSEEGS